MGIVPKVELVHETLVHKSKISKEKLVAKETNPSNKLKRTITDDNDNCFELSKSSTPILENNALLEDDDSITTNVVNDFFDETDELIKSNNKCNSNINYNLIKNNTKDEGLTLL